VRQSRKQIRLSAALDQLSELVEERPVLGRLPRSQGRSDRIEEIAKAQGISRATLYRYLKEWQRDGSTRSHLDRSFDSRFPSLADIEKEFLSNYKSISVPWKLKLIQVKISECIGKEISLATISRLRAKWIAKSNYKPKKTFNRLQFRYPNYNTLIRDIHKVTREQLSVTEFISQYCVTYPFFSISRHLLFLAYLFACNFENSFTMTKHKFKCEINEIEYEYEHINNETFNLGIGLTRPLINGRRIKCYHGLGLNDKILSIISNNIASFASITTKKMGEGRKRIQQRDEINSLRKHEEYLLKIGAYKEIDKIMRIDSKNETYIRESGEVCEIEEPIHRVHYTVYLLRLKGKLR